MKMNAKFLFVCYSSIKKVLKFLNYELNFEIFILELIYWLRDSSQHPEQVTVVTSEKIQGLVLRGCAILKFYMIHNL